MDERSVKRLLVTLAVSIAVILGLKAIMLKVAVKVNKTAAEKRQAMAPKPQEPRAPASPPDLQPAASATPETAGADLTAVSGVYGSQ